jgi:hypothetical protein
MEAAATLQKTPQRKLVNRAVHLDGETATALGTFYNAQKTTPRGAPCTYIRDELFRDFIILANRNTGYATELLDRLCAGPATRTAFTTCVTIAVHAILGTHKK